MTARERWLARCEQQFEQEAPDIEKRARLLKEARQRLGRRLSDAEMDQILGPERFHPRLTKATCCHLRD